MPGALGLKTSVVASVAVAMLVPAAAAGAPGDLDETFSSDGLEPLTAPAYGRALAMQPDNGTVVVGSSGVPERIYASVARYVPEGPLDSSFGDGGEAVLAFGVPQSDGDGPASSATDVAIQGDGSIVVVGEVAVSTEDSSWLVARLRRDGSLDPTFDEDGVVVLGLGSEALATAIDSAGRIVVAGDGGVVRLLSDGSLDTSFSDDGVQDSLAIPGQAIALLEDGSTLVGGRLPGARAAIMRLAANGEPDTAFGSQGSASFELDAPIGGIGSIVVEEAGDIVVSAWECTPLQLGPGGGGPTCANRVRRFDERGGGPASVGGYLALPVPSEGSVALVVGGRVLTSGLGAPLRRLPSTMAVRSTSSEGELDESFGRRGTTFAYSGLAALGLEDMALAPNGTVAVLGSSSLARFELDAEPRDSDADGKLNRDDACDFFSSPSRRGCLRIARHAKLRYTPGRRLKVRIESRFPACLYDERVKVKRIRGGRDVVAGSSVAEYGEARFPRAIPPGRYYAVVQAHLERETGFCERAATQPVRVPRTP